MTADRVTYYNLDDLSTPDLRSVRKVLSYPEHEKVVAEALAHKLDHLMDDAHSGGYAKSGDWRSTIRRNRLAKKLWATYKAYRDLR